MTAIGKNKMQEKLKKLNLNKQVLSNASSCSPIATFNVFLYVNLDPLVTKLSVNKLCFRMLSSFFFFLNKAKFYPCVCFKGYNEVTT